MVAKLFFSVCLLLGCAVIGTYTPPNATVEPLSPKGIRISVPHEDGITLVAFHVKFNEEFDSLEAGTIARDIILARNGRWTYEDHTTRLRLGDVVHYWVHVVYDGLGYNLLHQQHQVTEFFSPTGGKPLPPDTNKNDTGTKPCGGTDTRVIDPRTGERLNVCSGQLLLHEQFDNFNDNVWTRVEKFTGSPDYAFVIYRNDARNVECVNGSLRIKPSLVQSEYSQDFVHHGTIRLERCTEPPGNGDYCQRQARGPYILPPVFSGLITTENSLAFAYGKIEIRARLPRGDWIYPIVRLEQLERRSSSASTYPQLRIASSSGNSVLRAANGDDHGGRVLRSGPCEMNSADTRTASMPKRYSDVLWSKDYHVYVLEWRRDKIFSRVDGIEYGSVETKPPFDKPFYLSLGLAVGGHKEFPDSTTSDGYSKPWRNIAAKALLDFYNAYDSWTRTWNGDATNLEIDYVKVWAL